MRIIPLRIQKYPLRRQSISIKQVSLPNCKELALALFFGFVSYVCSDVPVYVSLHQVLFAAFVSLKFLQGEDVGSKTIKAAVTGGFDHQQAKSKYYSFKVPKTFPVVF